MSDIHLIQC